MKPANPLLIRDVQGGGMIFTMGNGGHCNTAAHMVSEKSLRAAAVPVGKGH